MNTKVVPIRDPNWVKEAASILRQGGVIAFPTDTVYGIGAVLWDEHAVGRLYQVKNRSAEKAIPVLIPEVRAIAGFAETPSPEVGKILSKFWPGPLTVILRARADLPQEVSRDGTVGIRQPDFDVTLDLLREAGPLAVTSANIAGGPSPVTAEEVYDQLAGRIEYLVDGGKTPGGTPSTVIDCTAGQIIVVRQGPVELEAILQAIREG
jgi:L-threonylcarbamoyladenylate synthase